MCKVRFLIVDSPIGALSRESFGPPGQIADFRGMVCGEWFRTWVTLLV